MDGEKKKIIAIVVFFIAIIVAAIFTELDTRDYEYINPVELQAVVTDKQAIKKSSKVGNDAGKKNKSSNYDYYVYVELEDGEEVKLKCSRKSEYEKYSEGQNITIIREELHDDGEFLQMVYSFKE